MPLDSGISYLSKNPNSLQYRIQNVFSLSENLSFFQIPTTFTHSDEIIRSTFCINPDPLSLEIPNFDTFCHNASKKWTSCRLLYETLSPKMFLTDQSYPNPFYRLLKDHWFFRWYEFLILYRIILSTRDNLIRRHDINFNDYKFLAYYSMKVDNRIIVCGPVISVDDHSMSGDEIQAAFSEISDFFVKTIDRAWRSIPRSSQPATVKNESANDSFPLYAYDFLFRFFTSRHKVSANDIGKRLTKISKLMPVCESFFETNAPLFSINNITRCVSSLSTLYDINEFGAGTNHSVYIPLHYFENGANYNQIAEVFNSGSEFFLNILRDSDRQCVKNFTANPLHKTINAYQNRVLDQSYSNWQILIYESFILLRNWLYTKFSNFENASVSITDKIDGNRLARFLSRTFAADEVSIYKIDYSKQNTPLTIYGKYSLLSRNSEYDHLFNNYMSLIACASNTERAKSISYRCIDHRKTQYCKWFDFEAGTSVPENQTIGYPPELEGELDRGISICAVPVKIEGVIWGVLELLSTTQHNFSVPVRNKIEESASIISQFFFFNELFAKLSYINSVVLKPDIKSAEKRGALLGEIPNIFLSCVALIIRFEVVGNNIIGGKIFGGYEDGALIEDVSEYRDTNPFVRIAQKNEDIWYETIGNTAYNNFFSETSFDNIFGKHKGRTLCALRHKTKGETTDTLSIICIVLPYAIKGNERWHKIFLFLWNYIATALENIYSQNNWEEELRFKLGHELTRCARALEAASKNTQTALSRLALSEDREYHVEMSLDDIERNARSTRLFSKILVEGHFDSEMHSDPRIYIAQRKYEQWKMQPTDANIRYLFNNAFKGLKSRAAEKNIRIPNFPTNKYQYCAIDEWCIGEVLSTIADNAVKYTIKNYDITIKIVENKRFNHIQIIIGNIGAKLNESEKARMFVEGTRGKFAKAEYPNEGSGYGLWYAREVMKIMGCDLLHSQRQLERGDVLHEGYTLARHDFSIVIPLKNVK